MIFYFTGTGNSLYVAKRIAAYNYDTVVNISSVVNSAYHSYEYTLRDNEPIGFVFPTYAWNAPSIVFEFIKHLKFTNYQDNYIFAVTTMGENTGDIKKYIGNALSNVGLELNSAFSIVMPNNYVIMGDVYTQEKAEHILFEAEPIIDHICDVVARREDGVFEVKKAPLSGLLTGVVNPLFSKFGTTTESFYANDNCIGCGLCEQVCNSQTIKVNGKPSWGGHCTQCLACFHLCPTMAIQYGNKTENKGRYRNPYIAVDELKNNF